VNGAEDVAVHSEGANFVCDEGDCLLLSWCEAEASVIVMNYCEAMYFPAVIVDNRNNYGVPLVNLNDGPLCPERFVIAAINARERVGRVSLYNRKMNNRAARRR